MKHEIVYQLRGEQTASHVAAVRNSEKSAINFCRNLSNFPADTIHYAIIREDDGCTVHDTKRDGLL